MKKRHDGQFRDLQTLCANLCCCRFSGRDLAARNLVSDPVHGEFKGKIEARVLDERARCIAAIVE